MKLSVREAGSLTRSRRWALYVIGIGVWLTGGLWLLVHYFYVVPGEFGAQNSPFEPWWLRLHGAFSFAAIWVFGLLWGAHVTKLWPSLRRRWSGGVMTAIFAWLIVSGYLLYYLGNETLRALVSIGHWGIGLLSPVFFLFHRLTLRKRRARQAQPSLSVELKVDGV
jgi:hypothetical protein